MSNSTEQEEVTIEDLAIQGQYVVERLRDMGVQVNSGHDRYIDNLADDAADYIESLLKAMSSPSRTTGGLNGK
jgi:hypothetical protein